MKFKGIIEGFYGRPWTLNQRNKLVDQFKKFRGLNTYVYAPKDDLKHRQKWRELYTVHELQQLALIIQKCNEYKINFIYAIAPGLDILYSSKMDFKLLNSKLNQIIKLSVNGIAILFDDIPGKINNRDIKEYESLANAQAEICNKIKNELKVDHWFFCPTVYCSDHLDGAIFENEYLLELSKSLNINFNIFWTGPHVISSEITKANISELKSVFKHHIVIWDNLFANDYDLHRCFMGPFSGRDEIKDDVSGILLNPNCEFELNFIPLKTFSDYCDNDTSDIYENALYMWYNYFQDAITISDLQLLTDSFHLPHKLGEIGIRAIEMLKSNDSDELARQSCELLNKISNLKDRELFHSIYPYAWELFSFIKKYREGINVEFLPHTAKGSLVNSISKL